jgi:hypothetical protein
MVIEELTILQDQQQAQLAEIIFTLRVTFSLYCLLFVMHDMNNKGVEHVEFLSNLCQSLWLALLGMCQSLWLALLGMI